VTANGLKEPGLYWWVRAEGEEAQPVRVTKPQLGLMVFVINERFDDVAEGMPGEFYGPITVPTADTLKLYDIHCVHIARPCPPGPGFDL
jgi:hypothetical protein